jgi:hypothetical protein
MFGLLSAVEMASPPERRAMESDQPWISHYDSRPRNATDGTQQAHIFLVKAETVAEQPIMASRATAERRHDCAPLWYTL